MLRSRFREGRAPGSKTDSTEYESKKSASSTNVEGRTSSRWSAGKVSASKRKSSRFENRFHRRCFRIELQRRSRSKAITVDQHALRHPSAHLI
ncbi:hypothetical protein AVEN_223947-1 [Araneus ventricosus]|uniref:Uncharacterized protein n=1 Tax=Araneus ventricosus TaxID=182803 RepID=A0A4Y2FKV5_ARAVE|nr:hypothetical protein AVEN_223947-1 [Araneus ventricosus]